LTHDYLVPSLREWLTRRQKETRRGRAELLLADRAAVWNARPENRQLPSLWQWSQICLLTRKKTWTPPQRKMMRRAARYRVVRGLVVAVLLALIGWGSYEGHGRLQAHALRGRLLDANTNEVPGIVQDMAPYRRWLDPLLHDAQAQAEKDNDRRKQLHASLALLPVDATQVEYLYGRLLEAGPGEVPVIRDALTPHKEPLVEKLWAVVESPEKDNDSQRLRAAAALAKYDPESEKWAKLKLQEAVGNDLVSVPAVYLATWVESLRPVREKLLAPLAVVYRDGKRRETSACLAPAGEGSAARITAAVTARYQAALYRKLRYVMVLSGLVRHDAHLLLWIVFESAPISIPWSNVLFVPLLNRRRFAAFLRRG
jgi:hypothetical protein